MRISLLGLGAAISVLTGSVLAFACTSGWQLEWRQRYSHIDLSPSEGGFHIGRIAEFGTAENWSQWTTFDWSPPIRTHHEFGGFCFESRQDERGTRHDITIPNNFWLIALSPLPIAWAAVTLRRWWGRWRRKRRLAGRGRVQTDPATGVAQADAAGRWNRGMSVLGVLTAVSVLAGCGVASVWIAANRSANYWESSWLPWWQLQWSQQYSTFNLNASPSGLNFERITTWVWPDGYFHTTSEWNPGVVQKHTFAAIFYQLRKDEYGAIQSLYIPYGWLIAPSLPLPAAWTWAVVRRRRRAAVRRKRGLCLRCGYDLRASPDRCPECGNVPQPPDAVASKSEPAPDLDGVA